MCISAVLCRILCGKERAVMVIRCKNVEAGGGIVTVTLRYSSRLARALAGHRAEEDGSGAETGWCQNRFLPFSPGLVY